MVANSLRGVLRLWVVVVDFQFYLLHTLYSTGIRYSDAQANSVCGTKTQADDEIKKNNL